MTADQSSYTPGDLLGVHIISEQVFCPRAMLIAHSRSEGDSGREASVLRLDYAPSYELQELESRLEAVARLLWQLLLVAVLFASVGLGMSLLAHWLFFWSGLLAAVIPARYFVIQVPHALKLLRDHRRATQATAAEPNPASHVDQAVNWWSLRAAGFVPHPVDEILTDAQLGFQGRPWRILRRGDLAIPAFVRNVTNDKPRPQQRARIDAYCHLIRVNEGADSPYGIVLDRGTFAGSAIVPNDRDRRTVTKALHQIPQVLRAWLHDDCEPKPPIELNFAPCKRCPYGRPVRYRPEETDSTCYGKRVPVYPTNAENRGKTIFHSACGDLFHWIPEHELAQSLKLSPHLGS